MNKRDTNRINRCRRCYANRETRLVTLTELATFHQTYFSQFASLKSTIDVTTTFTVSHRTSKALLPYTYEVGPSGIGWELPRPSAGAPLPPQPSERPGSVTTARVSVDSHTTVTKTDSKHHPTLLQRYSHSDSRWPWHHILEPTLHSPRRLPVTKVPKIAQVAQFPPPMHQILWHKS